MPTAHLPEHAPPPTALHPPTSPPAAPPDNFVRFVRAVRDKPVTRFIVEPDGRVRPGDPFGAQRVEGRWVYDTEAVHAITSVEWARLNREYQRAIDDGHLVEVKRDAFEAYRKRKHEARDAAIEKQKKAAEKVAAGGGS